MSQSTDNDAPAEHSVTIEFDSIGYTPTLRFQCHASEDADCRTMCPRSECEEGCFKPDSHTRVQIDYCNVVAWFENGDDVETWVAGGRTDVTLPIEVSWLGGHDGPEWAFSNRVIPSAMGDQ